MMKRCNECKLLLSLDLFYKNKSNKDGLQYACKRCHSDRICKITKKLRETNPSKIHEREKRYRRVNRYRTWARNSLWTHKSRGFVVNITIDELELLARKTECCNICGSPLAWVNTSRTSIYRPTLDRVNNEKEMNMANVQIACNRCNRFKGPCHMDKFVDYCLTVAAKFQ